MRTRAARRRAGKYDLLNLLIEGKHRLSETVAALVQPLQGEVGLDTPVTARRDVFDADHVAVVKDGKQVVGIVTKIDLVDFLGQRLHQAMGWRTRARAVHARYPRLAGTELP